MKIIQYLINGISIGSVYAIIALGYTMVYGIAKMLNFAHGDIIMVGAYHFLLRHQLLRAACCGLHPGGYGGMYRAGHAYRGSGL